MSFHRARASLLIACCALLPTSACAQEDEPAAQLQRAQRALRTGAYDEAQSTATRVLASDAANAQALRVLARALLLTGHAAAAESVTTAFIRANAGKGDGYVPLGDALVLRGRQADAESAYVRAGRFRASDSFSPIKRAEYSLDGGEWQFVEPVGQLSDSKTEDYDFRAAVPQPEAAPAPMADTTGNDHVVVVRSYDRFDNLATAKTVIREK